MTVTTGERYCRNKSKRTAGYQKNASSAACRCSRLILTDIGKQCIVSWVRKPQIAQTRTIAESISQTIKRQKNLDLPRLSGVGHFSTFTCSNNNPQSCACRSWQRSCEQGAWCLTMLDLTAPTVVASSSKQGRAFTPACFMGFGKDGRGECLTSSLLTAGDRRGRFA